MNQNGFFISVDAFLSVTVVVLFSALAFFYLSQVRLDSWNLVDLKSLTSDQATIMEKSLVFETAVLQSSSAPIAASLNSTLPNYCFEATILTSDLNLRINYLKTGCTKKAVDVSSIERSIIVRGSSSIDYYIARLEGWYK